MSARGRLRVQGRLMSVEGHFGQAGGCGQQERWHVFPQSAAAGRAERPR